MRTTLTIDDKIARTLKSLAHRSGRSFKDVVNETLRSGLTSMRTLPEAQPYRLSPHSMGTVQGDFNLDKALALAEHIEDEELRRKLAMNK
jgi:hypothetical protein